MRTSRRTRALLVGAVVVATVVLGACSEKKSPAILGGNGSESHTISGLWWVMFALAAAVYAIVGSFILVAAFRGRGTRHGRPTRITPDGFIWVGGIIVPTLILMTIAGFTVSTTAAVRKPSSQALRIDVVGKRWWWAVDYPGLGIKTANEIHVPVGQPLSFKLTSDNVIHSFWVPQIAGKVDTIPGQNNYLNVTVRKAGTYRGLCAEYCGTQHANMQFLVIAQSPGDFGRWAARESILPPRDLTEEQARGQFVFVNSACAGCHTIKDTQAQGDVGPDLTDVGQRQTLGAATIPNDTGHLSGWIANPQTVKPGNQMPPQSLSSSDLHAVVAYLQSLK